MEIRNLERMRVGRAAKDAQEVSVLLRSGPADHARVDRLRGSGSRTAPTETFRATAPSRTDAEVDSAALQHEVKRLRTALDRAVKLNEKMWNGVVDLKMGS
jgi:pre-rRNA-processing protein IPI3